MIKGFELENIKELKDSPIEGKTILYLGSSVTYGYKNDGISFVEYIAKRNKTPYIKETVSGTTLTDGENSYIERLLKVDKSSKVDFFVLQLSTNDAYCERKIGKLSSSFDIKDFDTSTIYGAIEYIIAYVRSIWGCPIIIYTNPYYSNLHYHKMVDMMEIVKDKWNVIIVDMYHDKNFESLNKENTYMDDPIHPNAKGYLLYMTPLIEMALYSASKNEK